MRKRIISRLLGVCVVLAFTLLSTHAISHWHNDTNLDDNCQICHVGHAAIAQSPSPIAQQTPAPVAGLAIGDESLPYLDLVGTPSIPRAPPA
jgi:hypothetical protein